MYACMCAAYLRILLHPACTIFPKWGVGVARHISDEVKICIPRCDYVIQHTYYLFTSISANTHSRKGYVIIGMTCSWLAILPFPSVCLPSPPQYVVVAIVFSNHVNRIFRAQHLQAVPIDSTLRMPVDVDQ
jgi:hypothetical protein